jgi:hypothetical protein
MQITTVDKEKEISLHCIDYGAVFKYYNEYYIKLKYADTSNLPRYESGAYPTVVCLEDGSLTCFAETTLVEVVDAELRVKE